MRRYRKINPRVLADIVARVVKVARPDKVILFGSGARGEMKGDSDLDLLVIKRGRFHRGRLLETIYLNLHGVGSAVDVVLVTPQEVERYRECPYLVIAPAVKDGKVVYAA